MEWTSLTDLREKFLSYFEGKGHHRFKSFSLVPDGDKSLLLINSGMAPLKKFFTGEATPPKKRATSCQKCIRTPDIDNVGKTARHGTFFEMLGNFSFGDYFKREAIQFAWEFCTKVIELPVDKLWISVYEGDDEAADIWVNEIGVAPERIVRLGKEDNFWEHGTGPCGPCSEIYFDRGPEKGCGRPDCHVGCDCDRYVEFWNLVFSQFDSDGKGNYAPLKQKNIDTGMGLERLACIMQGVDNLFEVDTIKNITSRICEISGHKYGEDEKADVSLRIITDHMRSSVFMISDGIIASNEGRGYVLRRLLRRAARHGRLLGIDRLFLADVAETVINENKKAYPELEERKELIYKVITTEEESFSRTIDQGLQILDEMTAQAENNMLSGKDAFMLYDTFGFPLDLTREILLERGMNIDEEEFTRLMADQRDRARKARKDMNDAWAGEGNIFKDVPATKFVGYELDACDATVAAMSGDGLSEGEQGIIALDKTPFYAESGGQVGDHGIISNNGGEFAVEDVKKNEDGVYMHMGRVISGKFAAGDIVKAEIDVIRRNAIRRNHTATHLLQAALRKVLGSHVQQAGSMVDDRELRFDFTHFSAMTPEEKQQVEDIVNGYILSALPVTTREMPADEAKATGAMALFGEKYGDIVRVVSAGSEKAGNVSVELCGGTHVTNTSNVGLFKIVSESSVASGVRRIIAVTGSGVINLLNGYKSAAENAADILKAAGIDDLERRVAQVMSEMKEQEREIEKLRAQIASSQADDIIKSAKDIGGFKFIASAVSDITPDAARSMCDKIKSDYKNSVVIIASVSGGKVTFAAACGKEAVEMGAHAGNIVKKAAMAAGGNGGGRPDSAMAGGKDASKVQQALIAAEEALRETSKA